MTNANALPIQERLRAVTAFCRFETGDRVAAAACLSEEAADRIDALEKALRRLRQRKTSDQMTQDEWDANDFIGEYDECIKIARAALGEGE